MVPVKNLLWIHNSYIMLYNNKIFFSVIPTTSASVSLSESVCSYLCVYAVVQELLGTIKYTAYKKKLLCYSNEFVRMNHLHPWIWITFFFHSVIYWMKHLITMILSRPRTFKYWSEVTDNIKAKTNLYKVVKINCKYEMHKYPCPLWHIQFIIDATNCFKMLHN